MSDGSGRCPQAIAGLVRVGTLVPLAVFPRREGRGFCGVGGSAGFDRTVVVMDMSRELEGLKGRRPLCRVATTAVEIVCRVLLFRGSKRLWNGDGRRR